MNKLDEAQNSYAIWREGFIFSDSVNLRDAFVAGYLARDGQGCQVCLLSQIDLGWLVDTEKWAAYWENLKHVGWDEAKIKEAAEHVDAARVEDYIEWLKFTFTTEQTGRPLRTREV